MEKIWGGVGENTHRLEKNAKMLEKINTIIGPSVGGFAVWASRTANAELVMERLFLGQTDNGQW